MKDILEFLPVNPNIPATLYLHEGKPALEYAGQTAWVPDSLLGRWYLKAHFPKIAATPEATQWYAAQDPMKTVQKAALDAMTYTGRKGPVAPKPYQIIGCARMMINNAALWFDMGLGKTFTTLLYFLNLFLSGHKIFLVTCPPTIFVSWLEDIAEHYGTRVKYQVVIAHGPNKKKILNKLRFADPKVLTIILTSHETLKSISDSLQELNIAAIACDEASKVKSVEATRSQAFKRFTRNKANMACHLLSGTPSTKKPNGYFQLYEILGLGRSGMPDYATFCKTYTTQITMTKCRTSDGDMVNIRAEKYGDFEKWMRNNKPPGHNKTYWELQYVLSTGYQKYPDSVRHIKVKATYQIPTGTKNLDQLRLTTLQNAYCLRKDDVAKDLPAKSHVIREVAMSDEILAAYRKFIDENKIQLRETVFSFNQNSANPHMKLHQICNGFFYDSNHNTHYFKSQPKIDELLLILEEAGEQKVVVWSPFRGQIDAIHKALTENEIGHVVLHGDVRPQGRAQIVHDFRNNPDTQCIVANPEVAGMGLTLIESHLAVVMANWFKADTRAQLIDRLHRIGQEHPVTVLDLITPGTMERRILTNLQKNIEIEGKLIAGTVLKGEKDAARDFSDAALICSGEPDGSPGPDSSAGGGGESSAPESSGDGPQDCDLAGSQVAPRSDSENGF